MLRAPGFFLATTLVALPVSAEEIRGRVQNKKQAPIEHAHVTDVHGENGVYTDSQGAFQIECIDPCLLLIEHPRFTESLVDVKQMKAEGAKPKTELMVELQAKQEVFEEIMVTASRGMGDSFAPVSIATTSIRTDEKLNDPSTLLEVVEGTPGVAENGQGGLFQVFSIRGVSRQRVMTLISGMQIVGERRAGVSTSFVDPLLMDGVEVLRGPSSTYYGSGALGGIVQVFPRQVDGWRLATGYSSFANEHYEVLGWGDGEWSFGFAHRTREDDTAADGTPVNERFTQYSASLARRWRGGNRSYEILAMPSLGRDIGKSSSQFPDDRITNYPQETHLLLKFGVTSDDGWRFYGYAHPNNLRTDVLRVDQSLSTVRNESFDLGGNYQREVQISSKVSGRYGFDYFGRRGVKAWEMEEVFATGDLFDSQTLSGERDDVAGYGALSWNWGPAVFQAGTRLTWHQQKNSGERRDDTAWTGFVGMVRPLGKGWELTANLGTGLRFPSLSERFFNGTTGRGTVIGNPDLDPEAALNADLGVRWYGKKTFLSGQIFRTEIDDYIDRVDVTDDLQTFVNLSAGRITGLELEGFYQASERWRVTWSGHLLDGEDDATGDPLADVSADRLQVGLEMREGSWLGRVSYQYRAEKDKPGSGEQVTPQVNLVSLAVEYEIMDGLRLSLKGKNLADEIYFASADRRAPVAAGRSVGVGLVWTR